MKNLKTYHQLFENVSVELTPEQIEWLDECIDGTWALNPQTGLVDVKGNFSCIRQGLTDFKGVKFGVVSGSFDCDNNQLTSLEGAPQKVGNDFSCTGNQLTSLEGAPQKVGVDFFCYHNPVTNEILKKIFSHMKREKSYVKAVESLWSKIPLEDQILLYRPEFEWVSPEEVRKLEAMRAYQGFKGMI
jgi:hypothetical protein